ncbi:restriction endonuclease [Halobacteria archaeon AArc-m2/3/4]|uniref:Restriction endonuclease n=1 Tax=Natronoglomus mannanivorans TaxID=2979990 RepID=A0ABT2Q887_9EURY|nr:restriction endonuclease [Halobacteria archaeon AArc-m2/3/4]
MPLTDLETALANAYPQDLEKLAVDLLAERGYDVEPTGTKGTDGGIDALLHDGDRGGVLHVSRTRSDRLRGKLTADAEKAADHAQEYDFFVFVTTADPSGSLRRRLVAEVQEEYGWTVTIWAREQLRNALMTDHQRLAQEHLNIDPELPRDDHRNEIRALRDERLDCVQNRTDLPNEIPNGPAVTVHVIPMSAVTTNETTPPGNLPSIPLFGHPKRVPGGGKIVSDGVVEYNHRFRTAHPDYLYLNEAGWIEGVSTKYFRTNESEPSGVIDPEIDRAITATVHGSLYCFDELGIDTPVFVTAGLLDVEDYTMGSRPSLGFRSGSFPDRFTTDIIELDTLDPSEFEMVHLRPILDRIWYQAGRPNGSPYLPNLDGKTDV